MLTEAQIKHVVDRFLGWKLPPTFSPDAGISFKAEFNENTSHPMKHEPSGTNLFGYSEADAMVRYMLEGLPLNVETDAVAQWECQPPAVFSDPPTPLLRGEPGLIEAVRDFLSAVDATENHTKWFSAIGNLRYAFDASPIQVDAPAKGLRITTVKLVYVKALRTIVGIEERHADKMRDLLHATPGEPIQGAGASDGLRQARKWCGAQASALLKLGRDNEKREAFVEAHNAILKMEEASQTTAGASEARFDLPTCEAIAAFILEYPHFKRIEAIAIANALVQKFNLRALTTPPSSTDEKEK